MAQYYRCCPLAIPLAPVENAAPTQEAQHTQSEYDKHRETLLYNDLEEGWASELRRYLGTMQQDVKKDTDIVEWWQVSNIYPFNPSSTYPRPLEQRSIISDTHTYRT